MKYVFYLFLLIFADLLITYMFIYLAGDAEIGLEMSLFSTSSLKTVLIIYALDKSHKKQPLNY